VSSVAVTVPRLKKIGTRYEAVLMADSPIHKFHIHAGSVLRVKTRDQRTLTDRFYILIQNTSSGKFKSERKDCEWIP
jgi:hypothetical protein